MKSARLLLLLLGSAFIVLLSCASLIAAEERWSRIRVNIPDRETLQKLIRAGVEFEGAVWKPGGQVECVASDVTLRRLTSEGHAPVVLVEDLAAFYASRLAGGPVNALGFGYGSMGGYYTLSEVKGQLDSLRSLYPAVVGAPDSIGASLEGRPIWAIRMTAGPDAPSGRPQVLYFAMQHGREPIGMMTLLYTMWHLAEGYGHDPEATHLLNTRELLFVPVLNVDAYESNRRMSPSGGGMRRKNMRNVRSDADGNGVDLNRNWDAGWGTGDSSPDPLSGTYCGTGPFSEPETQVLRDLALANKFRFVMEYHAYGLQVYSPDPAILGSDTLLFHQYLIELTRHNQYVPWPETGLSGEAREWMYNHNPAVGSTFSFLIEVGNDWDGFWPASSRIPALVSENLGGNLFAAWASGAFPKVLSCTVLDSSGDGDVEAGEAFLVRVQIRNFGRDPAVAFGVSAASGSSYLQIPPAPVDVAYLAPHADTTLAFNGRALLSAPQGLIADIVAAVKPAATLELRDTVQCIVGKSTIHVADGAETGSGIWTMRGPWGRSPTPHTGSWSFTDSPGGPYPDNVLTSMTLASPVAIPSRIAAARLRFWTRWRAETWYDYGQVLISTDGGVVWTVLPGGHTNATLRDGYSGPGPDWCEENIDVTHLAGQSVLLRFQFVSDASVHFDGWYVDDISLRSYTAVGSRLEVPAPLAFMQTAVGETSAVDLKLRSFGTTPVTITGLTNSQAAFSIIDPPTLPATMPAAIDSMLLHIVFRPLAHGPVEDTLVIACNDPINPIARVPHSGFGVLVGKAREGTMYVASTFPASSLFTLDTASVTATAIGPLGIREIRSMAVHPLTGELYGVAGTPPAGIWLYRISESYGTVLPCVEIPVPAVITSSIAFAPDGRLYLGTNLGHLFLVDPVSGDTALVGMAPGVKYSALCFHPLTGELWAADYSGTSKDGILKVDAVTGDTLLVGRTGGGTGVTLSLAFDRAGNLFALRGGLSIKSLLMRIDLSTGAGTVVDTADMIGLEGLAMRTDVVQAVHPPPMLQAPQAFALSQNYPNPFNPNTTFSYALPRSSMVRLTVYDMLGREVAVLVHDRKEAGVHEVKFDASGLASGVYLYRIHAGDFVQSRKLLLLR
jgi:carboxypeptidase T